jgi:hypothetical protein
LISSRRILGRSLPQPQLVAGAVLALRRVDRQAQQRRVSAELDRQDRVARRGQRLGAAVGQPGDDLRLSGRLALDQQLGIDPERGGDAVHPHQREVAHAGLEPADRLRGGRRSQAAATSASVMPFCLRMSRMRLITG